MRYLLHILILLVIHKYTVFLEKASAKAVRNQFNGRTHIVGRDSILRIRPGTPESPLPEYVVPKSKCSVLFFGSADSI